MTYISNLINLTCKELILQLIELDSFDQEQRYETLKKGIQIQRKETSEKENKEFGLFFIVYKAINSRSIGEGTKKKKQMVKKKKIAVDNSSESPEKVDKYQSDKDVQKKQNKQKISQKQQKFSRRKYLEVKLQQGKSRNKLSQKKDEKKSKKEREKSKTQSQFLKLLNKVRG